MNDSLCRVKHMDEDFLESESRGFEPENGRVCLLNSNGRNKPACETGVDLPGGDIPQTEYRSQPATRLETMHRHSSWLPQRQRVWESLLRCHVSGMRLDRFRECGSGLWLAREVQSGELHLRCNTCRDRLCKACGGDRAARIVAALEVPMCEETTRFCTLTKKLNHLSLAENMDLLYDQFNKLRRRSWWKENVTGGAAFFEAKYRAASKTWNVHFHLILTGNFLDQRTLSREWLACTGDSSVVDIRANGDWKSRAKYVTKYVTKPADETVWSDPAALDEFVTAIKGRRLCFTFGTWRGIKLSGDDQEPVPESEPIASINTLQSQAAGGDVEAIAWLKMASAKWPHLAALLKPPDD